MKTTFASTILSQILYNQWVFVCVTPFHAPVAFILQLLNAVCVPLYSSACNILLVAGCWFSLPCHCVSNGIEVVWVVVVSQILCGQLLSFNIEPNTALLPVPYHIPLNPALTDAIQPECCRIASTSIPNCIESYSNIFRLPSLPLKLNGIHKVWTF